MASKSVFSIFSGSLHIVFLLYVLLQISPVYKGKSYWMGAHLNDLLLTWLHLWRTYLHLMVLYEVLGLGSQHMNLGWYTLIHNSNIIDWNITKYQLWRTFWAEYFCSTSLIPSINNKEKSSINLLVGNAYIKNQYLPFPVCHQIPFADFLFLSIHL